MGLEAATFLNSLVPTNPDGGDSKSAGDDHLRLLKAVLLNTLPGLAGRFGRVQAKTVNYNVVATDNLTVLAYTGGSGLTIGSSAVASSLGNGFNLLVINVSGGTITFDPFGSETVNAAVSLAIPTAHAAMLWTDGVLWYSVLVPMSGNILPIGALLPYSGTSAPAGFVLASGRTIGNLSSGSTERANEDTLPLYTLLWGAWNNTVLPIQDFNGIATPRGISAALDFANSKRLPVPDFRGRVPAGWDAMGGVSANRLTATSGSLDGDVVGATGGAEQHTLVSAEVPAHTHGVTDPGHFHTINTGSGAAFGQPGGAVPRFPHVTGSSTTGISIQSTGGGGAHNNIQPTIAIPYIIKL